MKEKVVEVYLRERVQGIGGIAYKLDCPGHAGMPDRLVCLPGGLILFVELKAPGKSPRPLQDKRHQELESLGCKVCTIDCKAKVDWFIEQCKGVVF